MFTCDNSPINGLSEKTTEMSGPQYAKDYYTKRPLIAGMGYIMTPSEQLLKKHSLGGLTLIESARLTVSPAGKNAFFERGSSVETGYSGAPL